MATIAIGQRIGSGGAALGALIARRLEARFLAVDDLRRETASRYHIDPEHLRVFDTREPRFWESLTTDTTRLLTYFHAVILEHLAEDQTVLVSHAMPMWLPRSVGHVLRVRTVAPIEVRVKRLMGEERLSAGQAEHRVHESDREVRARMRSILKLDVEDPQLYDVVLNTSSAPLDTLAAVVIDLAHAVARSCSEDSRILLKDACIASQVRAALMAHPKIGRASFEITSKNGAVTSIAAPSAPRKSSTSSAIYCVTCRASSWWCGTDCRRIADALSGSSSPRTRAGSQSNNCRPMHQNSIRSSTYGATGNNTNCPTSVLAISSSSAPMPAAPSRACVVGPPW
jgi:cytidylate kinase